MSSKSFVVEKTFGFGMVGLKKFPELIPLVAILGAAFAGAAGFTAYALLTKSDVTVDKRQKSPPWERVNPETPQKIFNVKPKSYAKIPELEQLKKEIGSYKY